MDQKTPLTGVRVLVTRDARQAIGLVRQLEGLGAEVTSIPTVSIEPAADPGPLREACRQLVDFDWVVLTSANAVRFFLGALREVDGNVPPTLRTCAIGSSTADALRAAGLRVDAMPPQFLGQAIIGALENSTDLRGKRLLLPRSEIAAKLLPDELRRAGAQVHCVAAYRTVPDESSANGLRDVVGRGGVDVVTFTSGSTVRSFVAMVGTELGGIEVASIGPSTSAAAREVGLTVDIEAVEHTAQGLVEAIRERFTPND